jgi:DNA-binding CsgD family transcriptional regulator
MRLAEDPDRSRFAADVTSALGDGEALALLFGRFLPGRKPPVFLDAAGRPILTPRQVEMLREASQDRPQSEIAERLGISPRTVSTHMERIYRRLGVNKPMQAVARAIALGYLDLDAVGFVRGAAMRNLRDFSTLNRLLADVDSAEGVPGGPYLRRLAQFGLLLTLAAASANVAVRTDRTADTPTIGVVCCLDPSGRLKTAFGGDRLRIARGIAVAPPQAARQGFVPGAVYVINEGLAQFSLNTAEIVEYVPDPMGGPPKVRAFAGASQAGGSLMNASSLAFDSAGRLLVCSGGLTGSIVAFGDAGRVVSRFTRARAAQIAVAETGEVVIAGNDAAGGSIQILGSDGEVLTTVASTHADGAFAGVALTPRGRIVANRVERGRGVIEEFSLTGEPRRLFTVSGIGPAPLAVDARGRVYVPCPATCDLRVFTPDGRLERRIPLESIASPYATATASDGSIWVSGQAE